MTCVIPATASTASTAFGKTSAVGGIIWGLVGLLVLFWILGFIGHVGGGLIHFLLVIAIIIAIFNLIAGRSSRSV